MYIYIYICIYMDIHIYIYRERERERERESHRYRCYRNEIRGPAVRDSGRGGRESQRLLIRERKMAPTAVTYPTYDSGDFNRESGGVLN